VPTRQRGRRRLGGGVGNPAGSCGLPTRRAGGGGGGGGGGGAAATAAAAAAALRDRQYHLTHMVGRVSVINWP